MRLLRFGLAVTVVAAPLAIAGPSHAADRDAGPLTLSKTLKRSHLNADGSSTTADARTVTLKVAQTRNLHSRQPVEVSWSGAHPTGGIVPDDTASVARLQEYPFVLLECRGVDSSTVPAGGRLTPQTCWTQSVQERFARDTQTGFPPWRLDRNAPASERKAVVGAPSPRPSSCGSPSPAEHWLPFTSAAKVTYNTNLSLCGTQAPEASNVGGAGQPSNTQYGLTERNSRGSTTFTTWTEEDNASLGCSNTVPCALVAVPIMGISCDETAAHLPAADRPSQDNVAKAKKDCRSTGNYAPGEANQNGAGNAEAVSGSLWWSASNWAWRMVVPLQFAPPSNACDITAGAKGIDIYGSEPLIGATTSWRPARCLTASPHPFKHVQVGEPQARSLLANGTIPAAFLTYPPKNGWPAPVVTAPTAITGFSISYLVDDANGSRYRKLRLTPRLLAKLLTESYPAATFVKSEYEALSHNPLNLSLDPEFLALNPGLRHGVTDSAAASELFSISSNSDVMTALTTYLNADPEARAFLDGKPDPWGMAVNPSYKGIALPVESWPQRDTFEPKQYYGSGQNECLQSAPVPYLPLVAAPTARLANISLALQFGLSNPQVVCVAVPGQSDGQGSKLVAEGRQQPGFRFLLGLTSLGDASRYALDSAALQTKAGSFVPPSPDSLRAAAPFFKPTTASAAWRLDVHGLVTGSTSAYPGTMPVYTAVATSGLSASAAAQYASFLRFVAGAGQRPGLEIGQLPDGFLPVTAANGFGRLHDYALRAAEAVAAQSGTVSALIAPATPVEPGVAAPVLGPMPHQATPPFGTLTAAPPAVGIPAARPQLSGAAPAPAPAPGPQPTVPVAVLAVHGTTPSASSSLSSAALPVLLGSGLLGALASARRRRRTA